MGEKNHISFNVFPIQGGNINKRVDVCFNYDDDHVIKGTIVRDDNAEPYVTIIKLDDGRFILDTECHYSLID